MGDEMATEDVAAELAKRMNPRDRVDPTVKSHSGDIYLTHVPEVVCADGFHMSVQASRFHYCTPRNSAGPWVKVEVGFPSAKVKAFMPYGSPEDDPLNTVYGYVPIDLVVDTIVAHGGFAPAEA